jgi:hypothetical protein
MRTKTTLLTAALIAAGAISSMAQSNVYSLNVVGYVNVTLTPGFSMIANPLNISSGNTLTAIFGTNVPDQTIVFKFSNGGYSSSTYFGDPDNVWIPDNTLNPGDGAFIKIPAGVTNTITFTGEVMQGSLSNHLNNGFNMVGSQVPQAGALTAVLGYAPKDQDQVFTFNPVTHVYNPSTTYFGDPDNVWIPSEPTIAVGQGFFLKTSAGAWTRSFTVN